MVERPAESAARTLAEVVPRLGRIISSALESDPAVSLSLRQYRMLERLTERPHRTTELATSSGVSQPTASAAVAALEARGLVKRAADPGDRRATLIVITQEGRAVLLEAKRRVLERLTLVAQNLTDQDAACLKRLQPALVEGMDRARDLARTQRDEPEDQSGA